MMHYLTIIYIYIEREREREKEREREGERGRETDKQTDRQTDRQEKIEQYRAGKTFVNTINFATISKGYVVFMISKIGVTLFNVTQGPLT